MPKASKTPGGQGENVRRKLIAFDPESWAALDLLARDSMKDIQELADEAFRDLLRKHGRPLTLREALKRSAVANDQPPPQRPGKDRRKPT